MDIASIIYLAIGLLLLWVYVFQYVFRYLKNLLPTRVDRWQKAERKKEEERDKRAQEFCDEIIEYQRGVSNGEQEIKYKNKLSFTEKDAIMDFHRSVFVCGGAGSGKSYTFIKPFIHKMVVHYPCIIYDYKNPELIKEFISEKNIINRIPQVINLKGSREELALIELQHYVLDFKNPHKSAKVNPIAPRYIPTESHAREYANVLYSNLKGKGSGSSADPFWDDSAIALLSGCMWYLKEEEPENCNIPKLVEFILQPMGDLLEKIKQNKSSRMICAYLISAYDNGEMKLLTNVGATLQMSLSILVNETVNMIFSEDETPLTINSYETPTQLLIGNDEELSTTYAPLISLIMTVAIKQMNKADKLESFILLDEAPTLYIPKIEELPAVARSRKISLIYCCQDISQIDNTYGKEKREVLLSNLGNQFFGRTTNQVTIKYIMDFAGQREEEVKTESTGYSSSNSENNSTSGVSSGTSTTKQMRSIYNSSDITELKKGEFIYNVCENRLFFTGDFSRKRPLSGKAEININYYYRRDLEFECDDTF